MILVYLESSKIRDLRSFAAVDEAPVADDRAGGRLMEFPCPVIELAEPPLELAQRRGSFLALTGMMALPIDGRALGATGRPVWSERSFRPLRGAVGC